MGLALAIRERRINGVTILDLEGEITIGPWSEAFNKKLEELLQQGQDRLLLNLARVTKIDSSGISALVRTYVTLRKRQGTLKLLNPTGYVREVLEITNLLDRIEFYEEEKAAINSFG